MPIKFGKTTKQVDRQTKKVSIVHEYMKSQSIDQELIETYNKEGTRPKLRQKVKNEIIRRNKLGKSNVIFKREEIKDFFWGKIAEFFGYELVRSKRRERSLYCR